MMAFYFATSLIIVLFTLQGLYLCFCKHDTLFGGLFLQSIQALLHRGQVVAQPDGTHS